EVAGRGRGNGMDGHWPSEESTGPSLGPGYIVGKSALRAVNLIHLDFTSCLLRRLKRLAGREEVCS
ncbi:unnamed protein product, partial [Closterium sp. Naga37s-1]